MRSILVALVVPGSLALLGLASGCSDTKFNDGDGKADPVAATIDSENITVDPNSGSSTDGSGEGLGGDSDASGSGTPVDPGPAQFNLAWQWPCRPADLSQFPEIDDETVLPAGGQSVDFGPSDSATLSVRGSFCEPSAVTRDIVFALDVSGSMATSDPADPTTGECARSLAIREIVEGFSEPDLIRIGLVTYGTAVMNQSIELLTPADFLNSATMSTSVLCDSMGGGTYYRAGLQVAEDLLNAFARVDSQREVYFLSDGSPNPGQEGFENAARLKNDLGATLATIMLAPDDYDDSVLRALASVGQGDAPLHERTGEAGRLINILAELAKPKVNEASLWIRAVGTTDWFEADLLEHSNDLYFEYHLADVSRALYAAGIEIEIRYSDERGRASFSSGSLIWQ